MKKYLFILLIGCFSPLLHAEQPLTPTQREKAESAVREYFSLLSQYARKPMGAEALNIREEIISMFENMYNGPVYNDLYALKELTNLEASCSIDDYLLSLGALNEKANYNFQITYDSIVCQPLLIPSYAEGYNDLNALVYVQKHIEGGGISERFTNVIRYNLNTGKISYIEKASFTTSDEDIKFLLKNHLGYSTSKLNEMANRCYQEKKYTKAYQLYEQAAMRDDLDSQFALAQMLYRRQGCEEYAPFATQNMTKFWLKKIYFKYIKREGVQLFSGIWKPFHEMLNIVFKDEPKFDSDFEDQPFNAGLMKYKVPLKELYGFFDPKGNMVIPTTYTHAFAFSEGLACVKKNGKNGYIDPQGNTVIPFIYDSATPFINGTATIAITTAINTKVYYLINKKGEKISEDFEYIGWRSRKSDLLNVARRGNKWGFINGYGKIKVPFIYDDFLAPLAWSNSASDHIIAILKDGKWGFIDISDSEGKIIVPPIYQAVGNFRFGMAWVNDGTGLSYIDKNGDIVCGKYELCADFNAIGLALVKYKKNSNEGLIINKRGDIVFYCDESNGKITNIRRSK